MCIYRYLDISVYIHICRRICWCGVGAACILVLRTLPLIDMTILYVCVCMCIYMYVCVCVCVRAHACVHITYQNSYSNKKITRKIREEEEENNTPR